MGVLVALLVLVMSASLPLAIVSIMLMLASYFFGIMEYDAIWAGFGNYILFFLIAMFGLCAAIKKTSLPTRLTGKLLKWAGTDSRKIVFGFTMCTALTSTIMSDVAACAIFIGLALGLLEANGMTKPKDSRLGAALFISLPAGAVIGGIGTLSGNAMNVLAVTLIQQQLDIEITYIQWMVVGMPVAIIMSLIVAWWLSVFFKPEPITEDAYESIQLKAAELGELTTYEKKVIVITCAMIVFWIASSWIGFLNTNLVALLGLTVMFLPGVNVLTQQELIDNVQLDIILFLGCSLSFMSGFTATDIVDWFVSIAFNGAESWPYFTLLAMVALVPVIGHFVVQSGYVVIMMCIPPMVALSQMCGINPLTVAFVVTLGAGTQFLLPTDGMYLMTFGYGYYRPLELLRFGILPTIVMVGLGIFLVPPLVSLAAML